MLEAGFCTLVYCHDRCKPRSSDVWWNFMRADRNVSGCATMSMTSTLSVYRLLPPWTLVSRAVCFIIQSFARQKRAGVRMHPDGHQMMCGNCQTLIHQDRPRDIHFSMQVFYKLEEYLWHAYSPVPLRAFHRAESKLYKRTSYLCRLHGVGNQTPSVVNITAGEWV